jgi:hypothetical protein
MLRSAASVVAGVVTLVISSFAIEFVVDSILLRTLPHSFPNERALAASNSVMALTLGYTVLCAVLAGYVTARLAGKSEMKHALALAVVQDLLTLLAMISHVAPAPRWAWACNLTLVPLAMLVGGKWRAASTRVPNKTTVPDSSSVAKHDPCS